MGRRSSPCADTQPRTSEDIGAQRWHAAAGGEVVYIAQRIAETFDAPRAFDTSCDVVASVADPAWARTATKGSYRCGQVAVLACRATLVGHPITGRDGSAAQTCSVAGHAAAAVGIGNAAGIAHPPRGVGQGVTGRFGTSTRVWTAGVARCHTGRPIFVVRNRDADPCLLRSTCVSDIVGGAGVLAIPCGDAKVAVGSCGTVFGSPTRITNARLVVAVLFAWVRKQILGDTAASKGDQCGCT